MPPFENNDVDMIGLMGRLVLSDDDDGEDHDHNNSNNESSVIPLPLMGVDVKAEVVDFIAEVKLAQCYMNNQSRPIETTYHFPIDQAASVCGLKAEYDDGSVVNAVIKEKQQAREEFNRAKMQGKQANLLEAARRDILTLRVGNLAPGRHIRITLTYVTSLKAQEDAAAFILPTYIAPRYIPPKDVGSMTFDEMEAMAPPTCVTSVKIVGLDIVVKFKCHSNIKTITCPTHPSSSAFNCQIEGRNGNISLTDIAMDRDVVLLVTEENPHQPRASIEIDEGGNMVGFVTLFPQIEFKNVKREIIFLVDRSGSMGMWSTDGKNKSQIRQAGDAMLLLLRSLPPSCTFNIVGFGSHFASLFESSRPYNDESLEEASRYASSMMADFGGTDIKAPLEHIFSQDSHSNHIFGEGRGKGIQNERQIIVLTDGQVSNDKEVFDVIRKNCTATNSQNRSPPARVFTLGIGSGVSRHLVEGMARAGRGTARFVEGGDSNSLRVKVLGQLKQALQPSLGDVSIEWKFPTKKSPQQQPPAEKKPKAEERPPVLKTLLGYRSPDIDKDPDPVVVGRRASPRLYPTVPPPVFSRERFLSFAMFNGQDMPESVVVSCNSPDGPLEVCLNISKDDDVYHGSIAHRMAARAAISEYEDTTARRRSTRYRHNSDDFAMSLSKEESLELALKYGLVSEQTSFVAILERPVVDPGTVAVKEVIPQCLVKNLDDFLDERHRKHRESLRMFMQKKKRSAAKPQDEAMCFHGGYSSIHSFKGCKAMPANPKKIMDEGVEETTRRVGGRAAPAMVAPSMGAMSSAPLNMMMSSGAVRILGSGRSQRMNWAEDSDEDEDAPANDEGCNDEGYNATYRSRAARSKREHNMAAQVAGGPNHRPLVGGFAAAAYSAKQRQKQIMQQRGNHSQQGFHNQPPPKNCVSSARVRRLKKECMASCTPKSEKAHSPPHDDPLLRLCVLQMSDGKYLFDDDLAAALGLAMVEMELLANREEFQRLVSMKGGLAVFATALAVAAMRIKFASSKDVWELQEQKALDYLSLHGVSETEVFAVGKLLL